MKIRVGTRNSELAQTQTGWVVSRLQEAHPDLEIETVLIETRGDQDRTTPLHQQGGVGLFTKELERALLDETVDVAVHSLKDLPTTTAAGLIVAAIPEREAPWDAWVSADYPGLVDLPPGARVATGSPRRRLQILHRYPHLEVVGIRGNIDTRLSRYGDQGAAGVILAAAGLNRIARHGDIRACLGPTEMTPAPGQGALGVETRVESTEVIQLLSAIDDAATRAEVTAERMLMARLEAGCSVPMGALARASGERLTLLGMIVDSRGQQLLRLSCEGNTADPEGLAEELHGKLLRAGAQPILDDIQQASH